MLFEKYNTWAEVITAAYRTDPAIDEALGLG